MFKNLDKFPEKNIPKNLKDKINQNNDN